MRTEKINVAADCEVAVDVLPGDTDKDTFLLVHGLASNARMWDGVATRLSDAGYGVGIIDQRGHGRSSKPTTGYDFATITADLAEVTSFLAKTYGFSHSICVGQSWGGAVVESFARNYPELTKGIACIDGGFSKLAEKFPDWEQCKKVLAPRSLLGTPYQDFENFVRSSHADWPELGIQGVLANMEQLPDGTLRPWLSRENHMTILWYLWQHDSFEICADIPVPILFVPAGGDATRDEEKRSDLERLSRISHRSKTVWFDPSHHDIHAQFPERLVQLLIAETTQGIFA